MTRQEQERFARVMVTLAEAFDTKVTAGRLEAYFQALGDLPIEVVEQAATRVIRECWHFPRPADFRAALGQTVGQRAERAWATLLRAVRSRAHAGDSVRFEPALMTTVVQVWGTWPAAQEALSRPVDDPLFLGQREPFLAQYGLGLVSPPGEEPPYLPGERELRRVPLIQRWGDGFREVICERIVYFPPSGPPVIEPHPTPQVRDIPPEDPPLGRRG
jgi:hypothetical protein